MEAKVKIWIEDDLRNLIFGGGKTEVLEYIDQTGSIKDAAEKVGMNYKKAWNHIKILQENVADDLVLVNKGSNGGTQLTPKARELIQAYKILQHDINQFAKKRFDELFIKDGQMLLNEVKKDENEV
ncbi:MAG: winged helix-turn-helix domain-containing protein [Halarcobacter sp.]